MNRLLILLLLLALGTFGYGQTKMGPFPIGPKEPFPSGYGTPGPIVDGTVRIHCTPCKQPCFVVNMMNVLTVYDNTQKPIAKFQFREGTGVTNQDGSSDVVLRDAVEVR